MSNNSSGSPLQQRKDQDGESTPLKEKTSCFVSDEFKFNTEQLKVLFDDLNFEEACEWANCRNLKAIRYIKRKKHDQALSIFNIVYKAIESFPIFKDSNDEVQTLMKNELKCTILMNSTKAYMESKDLKNAWLMSERLLASYPALSEAQSIQKQLKKILKEEQISGFQDSIQEYNKMCREDPIPLLSKGSDVCINMDHDASINENSTFNNSNTEDEKILYYNDEEENLVKMGVFKIIFSPLRSSFTFIKRQIWRCKKRQSSYQTTEN